MRTTNWIMANHRVLPIGLDIGHSSVKMVQLAVHDDRIRVLEARKAPRGDQNACDPGARERSVVGAIQALLAGGQFRGRNVVSALPADKVRITSLRLPETEAAQADKILRREAVERFDLDPRKDAVHYLLAGSVRQGDEIKSEYILFAVDHETIRTHIRLLEEAGLTPTGLDASPCALFRTFERTRRRQEDKEKTIVFIDVGYAYTIVVFGRGDQICFVKQIGLGLRQFNDAVATALGVAAADAESFRHKVQRDESMEAATRRHIVDALNLMSEQLAGEISLCLRYYTVTFRGKRVERAVVAGGGAYEQVLLDVLRRHLSVDVEAAEPLRGFECPPEGSAGDVPPGSADLALAVGLSLKGWDYALADREEPVLESEPVLEGESL